MARSRSAGPTDLILFEKWMETTKWLFARTQRMPKSVRHTLSQRIETRALTILEDIVTAAYRTDSQRLLRATDDRLSRLRVLVRLAHELEHLSHTHTKKRRDSSPRPADYLGVG